MQTVDEEFDWERELEEEMEREARFIHWLTVAALATVSATVAIYAARHEPLFYALAAAYAAVTVWVARQ
jgi:lipopolysaccharide export LptBFGC system permease protein LptF